MPFKHEKLLMDFRRIHMIIVLLKNYAKILTVH